MLRKTFFLYKDAYSGLSRNTWYLAITLFINRSGTMVIPFMLPYMIDGLGFDAGTAGLIMAVYGMGAVLGAFWGGQLSDKVGFYHIQFISLVLNGIMFILIGYVRTPLLLGVAVFMLSLAGEAFRPANSSAIAYYSTEEKRTRSYALHRLAVNLGWGIGPAIGGILADIHYQLLFWVDGITCILAAVTMRILLPVVEKLQKEKDVSVLSDKIKSAYRDGQFLFFIVLTVCFAFCFFQMNSTVTIFYIKELGLSKTQSGLVLALNGIIIALFEMVLVYKLEGKRSNTFYIGMGILLTGLSFLFFNFFAYSIWLAIAAISVITLGEMLSMPFMNTYWLSLSTSQNRGQYAGLYTMAFSFAQIFSPLLGTQIMKNLGFTILWYIIALICLLTYFGVLILNKLPQKR